MKRIGRVGVLALLATTAAVGAWWLRQPRASTTGAVRVAPLTVRPIVPAIDARLDGAEITRQTDRLWPERKAPLGEIIHALRVFRPEDQAPTGRPSFAEMRGVLLNSESNQGWFNGSLSFIETRHGLRFVPPSARAGHPEQQPHTDQVLSILGELGVPLDAMIRTPAGDRPVRALFDDAVAEFQIEQELEWTAVALALYLPPARSWTNRFGEATDFDALARELMGRPLARASCAGTHTLYALAMIHRTDAMVPVLSAPVRDALRDLLTRVSAEVATGQRDDGSFNPRWHRRVTGLPWYARYQAMRRSSGPGHDLPDLDLEGEAADSIEQKVLVTGHHVEWTLMLPPEMQMPPKVLAGAAGFLARVLSEASDGEVGHSFCPFSHAARFLRQAASAGPGATIQGADGAGPTGAGPRFRPVGAE
ncbi:hypothetical protein [Singulisphaera acidiphila]|uniref:Uncharacterized protein n=2 Tax=Singulisphaera acidiphila TaxID=466153 RepID=L0DG37_SINAD|nr:hypothetical protein [Singulisphaera acidiphila]AGA28227.1 hypothetical protein Sinac_4004 [Singulisphaera acidiphila DSM 18658]